jgi:hypothetical protein
MTRTRHESRAPGSPHISCKYSELIHNLACLHVPGPPLIGHVVCCVGDPSQCRRVGARSSPWPVGTMAADSRVPRAGDTQPTVGRPRGLAAQWSAQWSADWACIRRTGRVFGALAIETFVSRCQTRRRGSYRAPGSDDTSVMIVEIARIACVAGRPTSRAQGGSPTHGGPCTTSHWRRLTGRGGWSAMGHRLVLRRELRSLNLRWAQRASYFALTEGALRCRWR